MGYDFTHKTFPQVGCNEKVLAERAYEVLNHFDICNSVEAVLIDNTNLNTGAKACLIVNLKNRLGAVSYTHLTLPTTPYV